MLVQDESFVERIQKGGVINLVDFLVSERSTKCDISAKCHAPLNRIWYSPVTKYNVVRKRMCMGY